MPFTSEIPWERYALIAEIARRYDERGWTLGKTALQKLIFMLQRVFAIDCGYSYTLYTYGPYSSDLARDLNIVEGYGGVETTYYGPCGGGYDIRKGPAAEQLIRRAAGFIEEIAPALDGLIADYGNSFARDLELRSVVLLMAAPGRTTEDIVRLVHEVKPHFSMDQIESACRELEARGYLQQAVQNAEAAA